MFAAASGARLAHRHKQTVKKQFSTSQIEGLQVHDKGYQKQPQLKYSDVQYGNRFAGIPPKRANYSSKLYSDNCDSRLKISSSYVDINGRLSKLGHVDFEGKAAWQDRELCHELDRRESICVPSEAAVTHRTKQREAHRRWVKRNRIHDLSFGECNSEDEFLYGVQNGAANLLLYIGLGTMCIGMIIAFVGTGEKGFKTMELRLIGPSLIAAGVLIIILRVMLCVCPSKCLKLRKQKQKLKNSTNKLNSEGDLTSQEFLSSKEPISEDPSKEKPAKANGSKKRVSIAMLPTTSGFSTNSSNNLKTLETPTYQETRNSFQVPAISFLEHEKPSSSKALLGKTSSLTSSEEGEEEEGEEKEKTDIKLKQFDGNNFDVKSFESQSSSKVAFSNLPETLVSPGDSDISIASIVNISPESELKEAKKEEKSNASKFETIRNPKNQLPTEIVLSPSNLNESRDPD